MDEAKQYIEEIVNENDKIVVAVSGGPDSMALLFLCEQVRKIKNVEIICVHVNHNKRKESEEEALFLRNYCENHNIIFEMMKIENYPKGNFQKIARNKRYEFFNKIMDQYQANYLFTAHHNDDLCETILLRLLRGSSLKGYAGFNRMSNIKDKKIVRPLYKISKAEILKYNEQHNIEYRVDCSNNEDHYQRNRIRHQVVPLLKKETNEFNKKINQFNEILIEADNYIESIITSEYDNYGENNQLLIEKLKNESIFKMKRIVYHWLHLNYENNIDLIEYKHIQKIVELIKSNNPSLIISMPLNYLIKKQYNTLFLEPNKKTKEIVKQELTTEIYLDDFGWIRIVDESDDNSNLTTRVLSDELVLPLYVRGCQEGDLVQVKNLNGTKKLSDIYINSKIPKLKRKNYPIVVDGSEKIIFVPGIKKTNFDKQKNEKYDIIITTAKKGGFYEKN